MLSDVAKCELSWIEAPILRKPILETLLLELFTKMEEVSCEFLFLLLFFSLPTSKQLEKANHTAIAKPSTEVLQLLGVEFLSVDFISTRHEGHTLYEGSTIFGTLPK